MIERLKRTTDQFINELINAARSTVYETWRPLLTNAWMGALQLFRLIITNDTWITFQLRRASRYLSQIDRSRFSLLTGVYKFPVRSISWLVSRQLLLQHSWNYPCCLTRYSAASSAILIGIESDWLFFPISLSSSAPILRSRRPSSKIVDIRQTNRTR